MKIFGNFADNLYTFIQQIGRDPQESLTPTPASM